MQMRYSFVCCSMLPAGRCSVGRIVSRRIQRQSSRAKSAEHGGPAGEALFVCLARRPPLRLSAKIWRAPSSCNLDFKGASVLRAFPAYPSLRFQITSACHWPLSEHHGTSRIASGPEREQTYVYSKTIQ